LQERAPAARAGEKAFAVSPQVLVESGSGAGKKEYEVVRDCADICIAVLQQETSTPRHPHRRGHRVAPSQTRPTTSTIAENIALELIRSWGRGECNIQYAIDQLTEEYRIIEVIDPAFAECGPRLEGHGYPLATSRELASVSPHRPAQQD